MGFGKECAGFRACLLIILLMAVFQLLILMGATHSNPSLEFWRASLPSGATAQEIKDIVDEKLKRHFDLFQEHQKQIIFNVVDNVVSKVVEQKLKIISSDVQKASHMVEQRLHGALQTIIYNNASGADVATAEPWMGYRESPEVRKMRIADREFNAAFDKWEFAVQRTRWHVEPSGTFVMDPPVKLPALLNKLKSEDCKACQCSFMNEILLPANCEIEQKDRQLVMRNIPQNSTVLEVGARYGSVSCAISSILGHVGKVVSVEADNRVWEILERNRANLKCNFHIAKGMLGRQASKLLRDAYASQMIVTGDADSSDVVPHFSVADLEKKHGIIFDVANFDCEGCFPSVFKDFPDLLKQLKLLILELHNEAEYRFAEKLLQGEEWKMVDALMPREYVFRRIGAEEAHKVPHDANSIKWTLQPQCAADCIQVCHAKGMNCKDWAFREVSSRAEMQSAFSAAGAKCNKLSDFKPRASWWGNSPFVWDGPWIDLFKGECGFRSDHPGGLCNMAIADCHFQRLCPCL